MWKISNKAHKEYLQLPLLRLIQLRMSIALRAPSYINSVQVGATQITNVAIRYIYNISSGAKKK